MSSAKPTRQKSDLADVLELVLDKGIVINADIAVTVGETELLGVEIRAAIASFETAAEYGLAFPSGTDMRRVEQASGREPLEVDNDEEQEVNLGINASEGGSNAENDDENGNATSDPPSERPDPEVPIATDDGGETDHEEVTDGADDESEEDDS